MTAPQAIIGVGYGRGPWSTSAALERAIYGGTLKATANSTLPAQGWAIAGERALRDAGFDCNATNIPIAVVAAEGTATTEALSAQWSIAGSVLHADTASEAVVLAHRASAVDALYAVLIIDRDSAVVIAAAGTDHRAYATIEATLLADGTAAAGDTARTALALAQTRAEQIEYIEFCPSTTASSDVQMLDELATLWPTSGLVRPVISSTGTHDISSPATLFGLIKAALCLHYGHRPRWTDPSDAQRGVLATHTLRALTVSMPWVRASPQDPLHAAVFGCNACTGAHMLAVLSGAHVRGDVVMLDWASAEGPALLPIGAVDGPDLLRQLATVRDTLTDPGHSWPPTPGGPGDFARAPRRLVLCAPNIEVMRREIDMASALLPTAFAQRNDWVTPNGSCLSPAAIGPSGKVALVYPGGLTAYPGLASDLHRCFPGLVGGAEAPGGLPRGYFAHTEPLYAAMQSGRTPADPMEAELQLHRDFATVMNIGLGYGFLQTHALRALLGVPIHGAVGYSLGEITMLYALGSRQSREPDLTRDDALFRERLGGPKRAIREQWQIAEDTPDDDVWTTMVLLADAQNVRTEVDRHDRVFLTHINTPTEVVIAGDPTACRSIKATLGCPGLPTAVSYVLHCPAVDLGAMSAYIDYRMGPVGPPKDNLELFSGDQLRPLTSFGDAANTAARTLGRTVDFPALIEQMYQNGYRYFIETGPGATATRWIGEILSDRTHLAVSMDRRGAGTAAGCARVLARLASHGVPLELPQLVTTSTNKEILCPTP